MSNVIKLPVQITCVHCENFMCGPVGMYCDFWHEHIYDEKSAAEECDAFTRV